MPSAGFLFNCISFSDSLWTLFYVNHDVFYSLRDINKFLKLHQCTHMTVLKVMSLILCKFNAFSCPASS